MEVKGDQGDVTAGCWSGEDTHIDAGASKSSSLKMIDA